MHKRQGAARESETREGEDHLLQVLPYPGRHCCTPFGAQTAPLVALRVPVGGRRPTTSVILQRPLVDRCATLFCQPNPSVVLRGRKQNEQCHCRKTAPRTLRNCPFFGQWGGCPQTAPNNDATGCLCNGQAKEDTVQEGNAATESDEPEEDGQELTSSASTICKLRFCLCHIIFRATPLIAEWVRGQKNHFFGPKIGLQFTAALIFCMFQMRKIVRFEWVGRLGLARGPDGQDPVSPRSP